MGMKYAAAYLIAVLVGKESPSASDMQKILESVEAGYDSAVAEKLVTELGGETIHEVVAAGKEKLNSFGGGGGGVAVAAAAGGGCGGAAPAPIAKEERKVEVEQEEEDVDFDLFG